MALLGPLDPRQQQAEQSRARTTQALQAEAELTKLLREHGQNTSNQPFTSPWQVAGQWANALAGRAKQNDLNQGQLALNSLAAPGGESAGASPQQPVPTNAAPAAAAAPAAPAGPAGAKAAPFAPEIKQAIIEGSQAAGVDPHMMAVFAHIESRGDPKAITPSGTYKGLMQLSEEEMHRMSGGQGNVWNPKDSVMAAGLVAKQNQQAFERFTGRKPNEFDTYMMHQQGPGGYFQHIGNPTAPAWQNMHATAEGRAKGEGWAKQAITGNGGRLTDTSQQFLQRWSDKWQRMQGGDHMAFQSEQPPAGGQQPGAAPSPGAAPAQGGAPGGGAPPTPPSPAGGGGYGAERGQQFVPPEMLKNPQPTYSLERLQGLARAGMPPEMIQKFWAEIQQANQPKSVPFAGGNVMLDPRTGEQVYIPKIENKPVKLPGGLETQMPYWIDSRGHVQYGGGNEGQPQGSAGQPGQAGGGLGAALRSGDIDRLNQAGIQSAADLEGAKKGAEQAATSQAAVVRGARGLGTTGAKIESLANDMHEVVSDPKWSQGGGMAGTRQALSRLTSSLGLDPNAATPRGVIEQASKILKLYQMEALKTGTSELGENAGRVFQTEAETLGEIAPTGEETQDEMKAKLKTLSRLGGHWRELGDRVDEYMEKRGGKAGNDIYKLLREHEAGFHLLPARAKETTGAAQPGGRGSADMPIPKMGGAPGGTTPGGVKWKLVP